MLASFAEYDRENIRERTQAGLHRAFRRGKHMGRIPYGYRANADSQLVVVEQEAEIVREIIANIAGGSTLYAEAKRLNDSGVPAPGTRYGTGERKPGRLWQSKTLSNIVHQSAYTGVHRVKINGGEEVIEREGPKERTLRIWVLWTCHVDQGQTILLKRRRTSRLSSKLSGWRSRCGRTCDPS